MLSPKRVEVVEYDAEWPRIFEQISSFVWPAVSDFALSIEHVGSTAVPGLAAKPIIDATVVVRSSEDVALGIERLSGLGYEHRGNLGVPDREAFRAPDGLPRHHLYLSPQEALSLKNHLGVRDFLRAHPDSAQKYGALKVRLAEQFPDDIDGYIAGKTDLILGILHEIGLTPAELAAIEQINRKENLAR